MHVTGWAEPTGSMRQVGGASWSAGWPGNHHDHGIGGGVVAHVMDNPALLPVLVCYILYKCRWQSTPQTHSINSQINTLCNTIWDLKHPVINGTSVAIATVN